MVDHLLGINTKFTAQIHLFEGNRIGAGLMDLARMNEVECFLHERTTKDVMKNKLIYTPGVLRKVIYLSAVLLSVNHVGHVSHANRMSIKDVYMLILNSQKQMGLQLHPESLVATCTMTISKWVIRCPFIRQLKSTTRR